MNRRDLIQVAGATAASYIVNSAQATASQSQESTKRKILAFGSGNFTLFLKHIIPFTNKSNPNICLIPTASGDSLVNTASWYAACEGLPVRGHILRSFVSSYNTKTSFEEKLLQMDAVFVGGGNTLNMLAIWKAQGIDVALRTAYEKGILMTGGSAGSLCWFQNGTSDSRPKELSSVECMGWLQGSNCPHFDAEPGRRPLYHDLIAKRELSPGYACDNLAGIYFENEKFVKAVSAKDGSAAYYVDLVGEKVVETKLKTELF